MSRYFRIGLKKASKHSSIARPSSSSRPVDDQSTLVAVQSIEELYSSHDIVDIEDRVKQYNSMVTFHNNLIEDIDNYDSRTDEGATKGRLLTDSVSITSDIIESLKISLCRDIIKKNKGTSGGKSRHQKRINKKKTIKRNRK
jgi:hypothetical protein